MDRYETCMVEWYWCAPANLDPSSFAPNFAVFFANGQTESHQGSNAEVNRYLTHLGQQGFNLTTAVASSNWILYTLARRQ
jgi:hypothetical protein